MKNHEILAPVGAQEQLKAAVRCGADAVYLGTGDFNARRNADNFSGNNLKIAVDYCHLRNVKVYVTLNTLVFDKEANHLYSTVQAIAQSGADAIIVQDFFALKAIKDICPQMSIHASTQMAVHNVAGAKLLCELGFSRIVLARELSLTEIKLIRKSVTAELEVFVHGAHCMSTSGNCYMSAMLGERSGNRGLCAQPCRLNWVSRHGREYALSLKDMSYLDSINELSEIGIESFKIEGRMKRPEYVAAAVTSLKKALNNEPYSKEALKSVFSRSGFTDGYLTGERNLQMFGNRNKDDVLSASNVLKDLELLYKDDIHPFSITAHFTIPENEPCVLTLKAGDVSVTALGDVGEVPRNAPLPYEIAFRNLSKLGETSFKLEELEFVNNHNLTLSASSVNAIRRDAVKLLENELTSNKKQILCARPQKSDEHICVTTPTVRVRLNKLSQYSSVFNDAEFIIIPIDEILNNREELKNIPVSIIAELPHLIYPFSEESVKNKLNELKALGISHGYANNIGTVKMLKDMGFVIHGAHGLNITNTTSLNAHHSFGVADTVVSIELSANAIKNLGGQLSRGTYVYGYLPLMLLRNCPQKSERGCCGCSGISYLTDRKDIKFPIICHNREYTTLHNSVPVYTGDKSISNVDFVVLYYTIESADECAEVYRAYRTHTTIKGAKTNGLLNRELL